MIECDECGLRYRTMDARSRLLACPKCGSSPGTVDSVWSLERGCPLCGCRHVYRRKAFHQLAGLAIIVLGAVLAVAVSYWFLLGFALLDLLLYRIVGDLAVCYRCGVEMASVAGIQQLGLFDHHTAEIYVYEGEQVVE